MKVNNEYLATNETMALSPIQHPTYQTEIHDTDGIIYSTQTPMDILRESCILRGSSYDGRIQSVRALYNFSYKTPLLLCQMDKLCAFPIMSPASRENVWIFPNHIKYFHQTKNKVSVTFLNDLKMEVDCTHTVFTKQFGKAVVCQSFFLNPEVHRQRRRELKNK
ncbi:competence protein ComK [Falsibacillus pallidus]|uniref:competence protein ComK n=1 Tax=Falsibacillus pallidus TaxID=493781 RepID=UPI003D95A90F